MSNKSKHKDKHRKELRKRKKAHQQGVFNPTLQKEQTLFKQQSIKDNVYASKGKPLHAINQPPQPGSKYKQVKKHKRA